MIWIVLGGLLAAMTVTALSYALVTQVPMGPDQATVTLRHVMEAEPAEPGAVQAAAQAFGTREFAIATALRRLGLGVAAGQEMACYHVAQGTAAFLVAGVCLAAGLPPLPLLVLSALATQLPCMAVQGALRKARRQVDERLGDLFARLGALIEVAPNVKELLDESAHMLREMGDSLLAPELERVAKEYATRGRVALVEAEARAGSVSPTLSLLFFLLRRFAETGGSQFGDAFRSASENVARIVHIRRLAAGKVDSAFGAIRTVVLVLIATMGVFLFDPILKDAMHHILAQMAIAGALGMMALGYWLMTGIIEEAIG
jgi:hypothetical protein